jgi:hypothetical protein
VLISSPQSLDKKGLPESHVDRTEKWVKSGPLVFHSQLYKSINKMEFRKCRLKAYLNCKKTSGSIPEEDLDSHQFVKFGIETGSARGGCYVEICFDVSAEGTGVGLEKGNFADVKSEYRGVDDVQVDSA